MTLDFLTPTLRDQLASIVRGYLLATIAKACAPLLMGHFGFELALLYPSTEMLLQTYEFIAAGNASWLLHIHPAWLLIVGANAGQVFFAGWLCYWLLVKALPYVPPPAFLTRLLTRRRSTPSQPKTRSWVTALILTACLVVTFHFIAAGISHILQANSRDPYAPHLTFFRQPYPMYAALLLSLAGIMYGLRNAANGRDIVCRAMGVRYLPADDLITQRVHELAAKLNLPPPAVGTVNVVNAFAIGNNPQDAAVVIGLPLLKHLSSDELDAVIGHELGHIAAGDIRRMQIADGFQSVIGGVFGTLFSVTAFLAAAASKSRNSGQFAFAMSRLGRFIIGTGSEMVVKGISRAREYKADATGALLSSPAAMSGALEKLHQIPHRPTASENRYGYLMFKSAAVGHLFATHPTLNRRVSALSAINPEPAFDTVEEAGREATHHAFALQIVAWLAIAAVAAGFYFFDQESRANADLKRQVSEKAGQLADARDQSEKATAERNLAVAARNQIERERDALQRRQDAITRAEQRLVQQTAPPSAAIAAPAPAPAPASSAFPSVPQTIFGPPPAPGTPPLIPMYGAPTVVSSLELARCDELAANPTDPRRDRRYAVPFPQLRATAAIAVQACESAVTAAPNEPRAKYQLARALYAQNSRDNRAELLFQQLVGQRYPAAFDNLGQILINRGDQASALAIYRQGVAEGDPDSMISLADMIRRNPSLSTRTNEDNLLYDWAASLGHKNAEKDRDLRQAQGQAVQFGIVMIRQLLGFAR